MTTIIFPVSDVERAKAVFGTVLGTEPYVDTPYYVGYRVDEVEVGLDPSGRERGATGPVGYCDVDDIEAMIERLTAAGAKVHEAPRPVGGGMRVAVVHDPDGNPIGLRQSG
jgi:predicted enzyme related to lactoylglutathione lyase